MAELDIHCLVTGAETGGRAAVFEERVAPGNGPPRHVHRSQTEIFHIIEGTFLFEVGGEVLELGAGGVAVVPAGAVHAFQNSGSDPGRIHFELLPAGNAEELFEKMLSGELGEDLAAFFERYDMDLVGPPLGR